MLRIEIEHADHQVMFRAERDGCAAADPRYQGLDVTALCPSGVKHLFHFADERDALAIARAIMQRLGVL